MLLTDADLLELTGYEQPAAQIRALQSIGLRPVIRKDGKPRVTWDALARAMTTVIQEHRVATPNFGAILRRTGT